MVLQSDTRPLGETDGRLPRRDQLFHVMWPFNFSCKLTVEMESKISYSLEGGKKVFLLIEKVFLEIDTVSVCVGVTDSPSNPFRICFSVEEPSHPTEDLSG